MVVLVCILTYAKDLPIDPVLHREVPAAGVAVVEGLVLVEEDPGPAEVKASFGELLEESGIAQAAEPVQAAVQAAVGAVVPLPQLGGGVGWLLPEESGDQEDVVVVIKVGSVGLEAGSVGLEVGLLWFDQTQE